MDVPAAVHSRILSLGLHVLRHVLRTMHLFTKWQIRGVVCQTERETSAYRTIPAHASSGVVQHQRGDANANVIQRAAAGNSSLSKRWTAAGGKVD